MAQRFSTEIMPADRFYYNKLFHDYIFNYGSLRDFFHYDPFDISGFRERIEEVGKTYSKDKRKAAVSVLKNTNLRMGAGEKTLENIERLSIKDSVAVIGGQQPGLFTGPVFIIYKVITVLKLSRYIQETTGTPVIPCFWNASDDSSLDQADRLGIPAGGYNEIKLETRDIDKGTRLSDICLDHAHFQDIIKKMDSLLSGPGLGIENHEMLKSALDVKARGGSEGKIGLAELFSALLLKLFSAWGLVIIDPADGSLKEMGHSFLKWDMDNHDRINNSISKKAKMLQEAGYHAQLDPNVEVLDFFINSGNIRGKVSICKDGWFGLGGKEYEEDKILEIVEGNPLSVSWNVVLRPLIQDTLFPVAATVCGPGEVSYFAQLGDVYGLRGISMPVIYPRFSATIIEEKIISLMRRTGIVPETLELDKEDAERALLKKDMETGVEGVIAGLDREIASRIKDAEDSIIETGMDPGSSFDRIRRNIANEIKVLSKKLFSALKKQNQVLVNSVENIYREIFPDGALQERKINVFYYTGKYGMGIIDTLYDAYEPFKKGHVFIYLEGKDKDEKRK